MSKRKPEVPRVPMPGTSPPPQKVEPPKPSAPEHPMPSLKPRTWTPAPVRNKAVVLLDPTKK